MRTFAQKPKTTQPNRSATSSTRGQLFGGQAHDSNSVLHLQSTIGSHTALRFLLTNSDIDQRARTMIHEWVHRYACRFDLGYEWEEGYSGHGTLRSLLNADPWAHFVYDIR